MTFYVPNQNTVIAVLFCLGAFLAFLYDIFSVAGRIVKLPKLVVFLNDLLFCLVSCVLFIASVYITNYGYVRWYEFASLGVGFGAYRIVFERYILSLAVFLTKLILKTLKYILMLLLFPAHLLLKLIVKAIRTFRIKFVKSYRNYRLHRFSKEWLSRIIASSRGGFER